MIRLGQGQSEIFDAVIAMTSIVMIRYLLLSHIMARHQLRGSMDPLFAELAYQKLWLSLLKPIWVQLRVLLLLSTELNHSTFEADHTSQLLKIINFIVEETSQQQSAKL